MYCIIGYVVQGSNGEYAYLTPEERVELVKKVVEWVGDKKLIIAGTGCECKYGPFTCTSSGTCNSCNLIHPTNFLFVSLICVPWTPYSLMSMKFTLAMKLMYIFRVENKM